MIHFVRRGTGLAVLVLAACLGSAAMTQTSPPAVTQGATDIKRTILQKFDVPGSNYETVIAIVDIVPNGVIGKHTHPGVDSGVLQAGDLVLNGEGRPELVVKPGESWQIPPGVVHWGKAGPNGAKIVNTYVVEKGKPLASPVQ